MIGGDRAASDRPTGEPLGDFLFSPRPRIRAQLAARWKPLALNPQAQRGQVVTMPVP